ELLAKITCVADGADIVSQRRAANADRGTQNGAHGADQARGFRACEAFCLSLRTDAGAKQGFACVDVSDSDDQVTVHQQLLDGDATAPCDGPEILGREPFVE